MLLQTDTRVQPEIRSINPVGLCVKQEDAWQSLICSDIKILEEEEEEKINSDSQSTCSSLERVGGVPGIIIIVVC